MSCFSHFFEQVIMVTVGKTPEFGREALAYRAAVNALASPETPHSAIRALQYVS